MAIVIYKVEMRDPELLGRAFKEAMKLHVEAVGTGGVWDAYIKLLYIEFEDNMRRDEYHAVFEVRDDQMETK